MGDPICCLSKADARDGSVDAWISMWSMVDDHELNDEEWARFQNEINVVNLADYYLLMWGRW